MADIRTRLSSLDPELLAGAREITAKLKARGHSCYLVGGALRDLLLGRSVEDADLATSARPREVIALFKRTVPTGLQHGTVTVLINQHAFEVTTYRSESIYSDARRPDSIEFASSIDEDLSRRDFTINALALDLQSGELIDLFDGVNDISMQRLRTIGRAEERFFEDGLRTVRACRFAAVLDFRLEESTQRALSDPEVQRRTAMVAIERFTDELRKAARSAPAFSRAIELLESSGLIDLFLDRPLRGRRSDRLLLAALDLEPQRFESIVAHHKSLLFVWRVGRYLFGLAASEAQIEAQLRQWRTSREEQRSTLALLALDQLLSTQKPLRLEPAELRRELSFLLKKSRREELKEQIELIVAVNSSSDFAKDQLKETLFSALAQPLMIADLALRGADLEAVGLRGKSIGLALAALLDLVIDDPQRNEREALLAALEKNAASLRRTAGSDQ